MGDDDRDGGTALGRDPSEGAPERAAEPLWWLRDQRAFFRRFVLSMALEAPRSKRSWREERRNLGRGGLSDLPGPGSARGRSGPGDPGERG